MPILTVFIEDEKNKSEYKEKVLAWLEADFQKNVTNSNQSNHFWLNSEEIGQAFDKDRALVMADQDKAVGYMTWTVHDAVRAYIEFVEVNTEYQKQGLFKRMLREFLEKYSNILFLSANVLTQAQGCFEKIGFRRSTNTGDKTMYYKAVDRPLAQQLDALPVDGRAIAIPYKGQKKYFLIDITDHKCLRSPIIAQYDYNDDVEIYFNKKLLVHARAYELFSVDTCVKDCGFFYMHTLAFSESFASEIPEDFFPTEDKDIDDVVEAPAAHETDIAEPPPKRRRCQERSLQEVPAAVKTERASGNDFSIAGSNTRAVRSCESKESVSRQKAGGVAAAVSQSLRSSALVGNLVAKDGKPTSEKPKSSEIYLYRLMSDGDGGPKQDEVVFDVKGGHIICKMLDRNDFPIPKSDPIYELIIEANERMKTSVTKESFTREERSRLSQSPSLQDYISGAVLSTECIPKP